jgi:hypothetical protein
MFVVALAIVALGAAASAASARTQTAATGPDAKGASCQRGSKPSIIAGNFKCLRVGQRCSTRYQGAYRKYGFHCVNGRLRKGTGIKPPASTPEPTPTPAPAPTPAPTPAALDGHYKGLTSQNETLEFNIMSGGLAFRGLKTGQINEGCTPHGSIYGNYFDWPDYIVSVTLSGDFTIDTDIFGYHVGSSPASAHLTIHGHMTGQAGIGSLELKSAFTDLSTGVSYTCGSGLQTWTVTRTG